MIGDAIGANITMLTACLGLAALARPLPVGHRVRSYAVMSGVAGLLALAALWSEVATSPLARSIVTGVAAAGAGLFIGTAIKLGKPLARKPAALVVIAGCFIAVGIGRVSMLLVIPVALLISYLLARRGLL